MIYKIIAGGLASILDSLVLGLIFIIQNLFVYQDDLIWGALIYYLPAMLFLILFSRCLIYLINQTKRIKNFLKTETALFLIALIGLLILNFFKDKNNYDFVLAFAIAYLIAMLIYLQLKKLLKHKTS